MKLTALIPVRNDDYMLRFCLAALVEHVDRIIVLDDASTDESWAVANSFADAHAHVQAFRAVEQLGWVKARHQLLDLAGDDQHLFWLDSDDVLCEYNAWVLGAVASGGQAVVRLPLCELWGDFNHTTQRSRHYDRCHIYVNRGLWHDFAWTGTAGAKPVRLSSMSPGRSGGPLLFHCKGVKPDRRLVERMCFRRWLRAQNSPHSAAGIEQKSEEEIHQAAVAFLLTSHQDRIRWSYRPGVMREPLWPRRPRVILQHIEAGQRFEVLYRDGTRYDRTDKGHTPGDALETLETPW